MLATTDALALLLAMALAYQLWAGPVRNQPPELYVRLLPLLPVFLLAFAKWRLYPGFALGAAETLRRLSLATTMIFLSVVAMGFALKVPVVVYSRVSFGLAWLLALVLLPLSRFVVLSAVRRLNWWSERCVLVGTSPLAAETVKALRRARTLGLAPVACVSVQDDPPADVEGVPVVGGPERLAEIAEMGVPIALVVGDSEVSASELLPCLQKSFHRVILLQSLEGLPLEGVGVHNLGGVLGLEFADQLQRRSNQLAKRTVDIAVGLPLLVVALPVIGIAALLIRCVDGWPVIFRQQREGLNGKLFTLPKLRTMRRGSESRLREHLSAFPEAQREWDSRFKLRDDPRLIPVLGPLLRRLSIDELPQLWSVVRGDMSLVGPRPLPTYHLETFSESFRELRRQVRPGLTGLWQVMARDDAGEDKKAIYDGYYIRNWSPWLDMHILALTIVAVGNGRGAH